MHDPLWSSVITLGKYEVLARVARGGMADLWLSRTRGVEGFERHVLIKRIRADLEGDEQLVEAFLSEARLAALLHHGNIVQIHDVGLDNGRPYIAMEYVHGIDVRRLLAKLRERSEQLPIEHLVTIATGVAAALHHAHEQVDPDRKPLGLVHRDVTPGNILIAYDGTIKVADFGIAKATLQKGSTDPGARKGKVPYMSPEQCSGQPIDRRSDVFGVGILLYELATARRLFKGGNDYATMQLVMTSEIPKPSTVRRDLPPALDGIILQALERDRDRRFASARELLTALEMFATQNNIRTSQFALAAYVKRLFGSRPEPWLELGALHDAADGTPPNDVLDPPAEAAGTIDAKEEPRAMPRAPSVTIDASMLRVGDSTDLVTPLPDDEDDILYPPAPRSSRWWLALLACAAVAAVVVAIVIGFQRRPTIATAPARARPAALEAPAVARAVESAPAEPVVTPAPIVKPEVVKPDVVEPEVVEPDVVEPEPVVKSELVRKPKPVAVVVKQKSKPPKSSRSKPGPKVAAPPAAKWDENGLFPNKGE